MDTSIPAGVMTLAQQHGIKQVALVVRDLEASVRAYWELLRIGPWTAFTYDPSFLRDMRYHGKEARFGLRHALAWREGVQLELVQPLEGPSIFQDHLDAHGEGLHHLGIYVPDHASAVRELEGQGFQPLQQASGFGRDGDGAFAYFACPLPLAAIVELIGAPSARRDPDFVYPAEPG